MTDHWHPELVQDNTRTEPPARRGYHLTEDLIDHAIADVRNQTAVTPEKPFFLYVALGAAHAPHQVAQPYVDKYVPLFQKGWDEVRRDRLARQKRLGIVPANTELSPRNEGVRPWDKLSHDEQTLFVRLQAAYAGFLDTRTTRSAGSPAICARSAGWTIRSSSCALTTGPARRGGSTAA